MVDTADNASVVPLHTGPLLLTVGATGGVGSKITNGPAITLEVQLPVEQKYLNILKVLIRPLLLYHFHLLFY